MIAATNSRMNANVIRDIPPTAIHFETKRKRGALSLINLEYDGQTWIMNIPEARVCKE